MGNRDHNWNQVKREENLAGGVKGKLLELGTVQKANCVRLREEQESHWDSVAEERAGRMMPRA